MSLPAKLDRILAELSILRADQASQEARFMAVLDGLRVAVAQVSQGVASVSSGVDVLIANVVDARANAVNPVDVAAIQNDLATTANALNELTNKIQAVSSS